MIRPLTKKGEKSRKKNQTLTDQSRQIHFAGRPIFVKDRHIVFEHPLKNRFRNFKTFKTEKCKIFLPREDNRVDRPALDNSVSPHLRFSTLATTTEIFVRVFSSVSHRNRPISRPTGIKSRLDTRKFCVRKTKITKHIL